MVECFQWQDEIGQSVDVEQSFASKVVKSPVISVEQRKERSRGNGELKVFHRENTTSDIFGSMYFRHSSYLRG